MANYLFQDCDFAQSVGAPIAKFVGCFAAAQEKNKGTRLVSPPPA
jgi:hypothetical protein